MMKGMYNWLGKHVHASYGIYIFALLLFIEGFFIIPASTLLAFFCLENRNKALIYALVATIMSCFGAIAGYYLGSLLYDAAGQKIIHYLISEEKFTYLIAKFKEYQALTVFFTAFTPMPFKALTLTAGFCKMPLLPFLFFTFLARGLRFFAIAISIFIWGEQVNYYINKYFYYLVAFGIAFFIFTLYIFH